MRRSKRSRRDLSGSVIWKDFEKESASGQNFGDGDCGKCGVERCMTLLTHQQNNVILLGRVLSVSRSGSSPISQSVAISPTITFCPNQQVILYIYMEGIGTTSLWGFSRAIDFQDLCAYMSSICRAFLAQTDHQSNPNTTDTAHAERDIKDVKNTILKKKQQRRDSTIPLQPLKILLLGASDPRHIIKTVARAGRYQKRDLHVRS